MTRIVNGNAEVLTAALPNRCIDLIVERVEFADSFTLASDAQVLMARLIREVDEFVHLSEARIACVSSQRTPMLRGTPCLAFIGVPSVQGPFSPLFDWSIANLCEPLFERELPDFLLMLDAAVWPTLDALRRERLVFHELKHVVVREDEFGVPKFGKDHRPALKLVPHDFEFFDSEVRRYGADTCELVDAALAIAAGQRTSERRRGPRAA